jgi:hypothetical protein
MKSIFTILPLFLFVQFSFAQKDSLHISATLQGQARMQTGNLKQFGGQMGASLHLDHRVWFGGLNIRYAYNNVDGFEVLNDSWNFAVIKKNHSNQFYPIGMFYQGFAKSFGVDYAAVSAVGVGWNINRSAEDDYLHMNILGGYMDFDYHEQSGVHGYVLNFYGKGQTALVKEKLNLLWEMHAYHAMDDSDVYGLQNSLQLAWPLSSAFSLTLSREMVYSEKVDFGKKQLNTISMFGVFYKL